MSFITELTDLSSIAVVCKDFLSLIESNDMPERWKNGCLVKFHYVPAVAPVSWRGWYCLHKLAQRRRRNPLPFSVAEGPLEDGGGEYVMADGTVFRVPAKDVQHMKYRFQRIVLPVRSFLFSYPLCTLAPDCPSSPRSPGPEFGKKVQALRLPNMGLVPRMEMEIGGG